MKPYYLHLRCFLLAKFSSFQFCQNSSKGSSWSYKLFQSWGFVNVLIISLFFCQKLIDGVLLVLVYFCNKALTIFISCFIRFFIQSSDHIAKWWSFEISRMQCIDNQNITFLSKTHQCLGSLPYGWWTFLCFLDKANIDEMESRTCFCLEDNIFAR